MSAGLRRLQVRLYGEEELSDIDPRRAAALLNQLQAVDSVDISDDRAFDAWFATLYVNLSAWTGEALAALEQSLRGLPRMEARLVDGRGEETELDAATPADWEAAAAALPSGDGADTDA